MSTVCQALCKYFTMHYHPHSHQACADCSTTTLTVQSRSRGYDMKVLPMTHTRRHPGLSTGTLTVIHSWPCLIRLGEPQSSLVLCPLSSWAPVTPSLAFPSRPFMNAFDLVVCDGALAQELLFSRLCRISFCLYTHHPIHEHMSLTLTCTWLTCHRSLCPCILPFCFFS